MNTLKQISKNIETAILAEKSQVLARLNKHLGTSTEKEMVSKLKTWTNCNNHFIAPNLNATGSIPDDVAKLVMERTGIKAKRQIVSAFKTLRALNQEWFYVSKMERAQWRAC